MNNKPYLLIKDKDGKLVGVKPTMDYSTHDCNDSPDCKVCYQWRLHIQQLPSLHLDDSIKGKEGDRVDGVEQWQILETNGEWVDTHELMYKKFPGHLHRITLKAVEESESDKKYGKYIDDGHNIRSTPSPDQSQEAQKQGAWKPSPKPADAECKECSVDEPYDREITAGGVHCLGCGRKRPGTKYVLLAAQPAEEWVAVSDRLPEEGGRYWCYCESVGDLGNSYFQWNCAYDPQTRTFHDFAYSFKDGEQVTHWKPLPAPPSNQNKK